VETSIIEVFPRASMPSSYKGQNKRRVESAVFRKCRATTPGAASQRKKRGEP
jgi:hypothetical protein